MISRDRAELGAISAGVLSSSLDVMEMASAPVSLQAGVAVGKQWAHHSLSSVFLLATNSMQCDFALLSGVAMEDS